MVCAAILIVLLLCNAVGYWDTRAAGPCQLSLRVF